MSQQWERTPGTAPAATPLTPYTGPIGCLISYDLDYFLNRYEISAYYADRYIARAMSEPRYILPILAPNGQERGVVARTGWAGSPLTSRFPVYKKALTYMSARQPVQSFYYGHAGRGPMPLVLVEDQLSAIKLVSTGAYNAVALLGVPNGGNIGADRVREITKVLCSEVIVALDADATENAFQFVRKYGLCFRSIRVSILERDIKDSPKAEFMDILGV